MKCFIALILVGLTALQTAADEPAAEIARLKSRVVALEAENRLLRARLDDIAALVGSPLPVPTETLVIRLGSDNWGEAAKPDVLKVLTSAATPLWKSAGSPPLHALAVENNSEGPLVAYRRKPDGAYRVLINTEGRLWAQMAFQFSHEVGHVLSNYRDGANAQRWFEESICECASLYTLRRMGEAWKTEPPYPNWQSYAGALTQYASDRIEKAASIPNDDLAAWYSVHKDTLDKNATKRDLNLIVAVRMLPIFEKHEHSWTAIRSLNLGNRSENETLERYFEGWHSRVNARDRVVVREIAALFSLTLPEE